MSIPFCLLDLTSSTIRMHIKNIVIYSMHIKNILMHSNIKKTILHGILNFEGNYIVNVEFIYIFF